MWVLRVREAEEKGKQALTPKDVNLLPTQFC